MGGRRRSWREKLEAHKEPKISKLLIPGSADIEELVSKIPEGKLLTDAQIKEHLKALYGVDVVCAKVLGIQLRLLAEAAEEEALESGEPSVPYWRVIKRDGALFPNFPGGQEAQAERLRKEGHTIERGRGRRLRVRDFERYLVAL